jgi:putative oxidoreductase
MSALVAALRVGLGVLFLWAGATKIPDMAAFAESVANYRLLPAALVPTVAAVVVGVEIVAGALLVVGRLSRAASFVAAALLAVFTLGLAQALLRGIDLRCGCFGGEESATWLTVLRDLGMLAAATVVLLRGPGQLLARRPRAAGSARTDGASRGEAFGAGAGSPPV